MGRIYRAPPTIGAFMKCENRLQFLFGPLGGGKTTGALMKLLEMAHAQPPNENGSRGTGTPTFTPTIPALARSITRRAIPPLSVNTDAAFP